MKSVTPFDPNDQVRNTKFNQVYHWAMSIGKTPTNAYFIAKNKTLKDFPINPSEPLYFKHQAS